MQSCQCVKKCDGDQCSSSHDVVLSKFWAFVEKYGYKEGDENDVKYVCKLASEYTLQDLKDFREAYDIVKYDILTRIFLGQDSDTIWDIISDIISRGEEEYSEIMLKGPQILAKEYAIKSDMSDDYEFVGELEYELGQDYGKENFSYLLTELLEVKVKQSDCQKSK